MAGGQMRKVWDKLLSPFKQVEKRQLQHEIDIHRLFLLTSYNRMGASGGEETADEIQAAANSMPFAAQQSEVQSNVHQQIAGVVDILDNILLKAPRKTDVRPQKWQSGLSFAVGGVAQEPRAEISETHPLTRNEVSAMMHERLGFTLECKRSTIDHEEAGEGLFLCGMADPGTVVSMYPGIIYAPSQYRYMPRYPRVDTGNPYLISRYDGLILDGKPWGRGGDSREWWDGTNPNGMDPPEQTADRAQTLHRATGQPDKARDRQGVWESIAGSQNRVIPIKSAMIERRNPLAFGHFANHPPKGTKPNVMICGYSLNAEDDVIRPYVPNVVLATEEEQMERQGLLWFKEGRKLDDFHGKQSSPAIRTLVLVATQTLKDEELMLNYRLSSHIKTPAWYHPVNEEEDQRRWE